MCLAKLKQYIQRVSVKYKCFVMFVNLIIELFKISAQYIQLNLLYMITNKSTLLACSGLLLSSLALPTFSAAAPLVSVGDNVDVFFNGATSLRWSSNVFRNNTNEVEDVTFSVKPGFDINIGRGLSNADFSIITRYELLRYDDLSDLDTELLSIAAKGAYKTSRLELNGLVSFDEYQANSGDEQAIDALVKNEVTAANINGEYRTSPKFSVAAGVRYNDKVYTNDGEYFENNFADREKTSVPLDVYYELTPKLDLSFGYTYDNTEVGDVALVGAEGGAVLRTTSEYETESHFFNLGARGQLLPKLSGFFKVGYSVRSADDSDIVTLPDTINLLSQTNRKDKGILATDANFTWTVNPKLKARFNLSSDFGVGGDGGATEITRFGGSLSYKVDAQISARVNASSTSTDYDSGREDDQFLYGASLSYRPNQFWSISGGYSFADFNASDDSRSYTSHVLNLSASLRY